MTIYIDTDFRCYTEAAPGLRAVETDAFSGKCTAYIEGCRFVPSGECWTRADGTVFRGEMLSPTEDSAMLEKAQRQYEEGEDRRLGELGIPREAGFTATKNYPAGSFVGIQGELYEVIGAIPRCCSIIAGQNVIKTSVEHYLDTLKEGTS